MSAEPLQALVSAGKGKNTLGLLRVIILSLIAAAAIASRLFSVIRTWPFFAADGAAVCVVELWCSGAQLGIHNSPITQRIRFQSPLCANRVSSV